MAGLTAAFLRWGPLLTDTFDLVASLLVISAVVEFSNKGWRNKRAQTEGERERAEVAYMDDEFLVAKRRSLIALVFVCVGYLCKALRFRLTHK